MVLLHICKHIMYIIDGLKRITSEELLDFYGEEKQMEVGKVVGGKKANVMSPSECSCTS